MAVLHTLGSFLSNRFLSGRPLCLLTSPVCVSGLIPLPLTESALINGKHASRNLSPAFFSLQTSTNVFWILGNVHLEPVRTWMAPTDVFAHLGTAYSKTNVKVRAADRRRERLRSCARITEITHFCDAICSLQYLYILFFNSKSEAVTYDLIFCQGRSSQFWS